MQRPKTVEQYIDLIDQAIFELEELHLASEYDMESSGKNIAFIDTLESQVRLIKQQMQNGEYRFENKDLPFMQLIDQVDDRVLPFKILLKTINETHRLGLMV